MGRFDHMNRLFRSQESISTDMYKVSLGCHKFSSFLNDEFKPTRFQNMQKKYYNRCLLTGYGRNILLKFKLAKKSLKSLTNFGLVPGFKRHSW